MMMGWCEGLGLRDQAAEATDVQEKKWQTMRVMLRHGEQEVV